MNLSDMMAEEEARMLAKERELIAAEKAAWLALSQVERDAITAEKEAKWERFAEAAIEAVDDDLDEPCSGCGEPDCDNDCDGEYDD